MYATWGLGSRIVGKSQNMYALPSMGEIRRLDVIVSDAEEPYRLTSERVAELLIRDGFGQNIVSMRAQALGGITRDGIFVVRFDPALPNYNVAASNRIEIRILDNAAPVALVVGMFCDPVEVR